jgi:hypothetical protein
VNEEGEPLPTATLAFLGSTILCLVALLYVRSAVARARTNRMALSQDGPGISGTKAPSFLADDVTGRIRG